MKIAGSRLCLALAALLTGFGASAQAPGARGLFGTVEIRAESLAALPQWTSVLERLAEEKQAYAACDADNSRCGARGFLVWRSFLKSLRGVDPLFQVREVNRFVNERPVNTDQAAFGIADHWATPLEFLDRGGDAEDQAIMKFVSLRELGFGNDGLRVVIVRDTLRGVTHTVLAAVIGEETLILDGLGAAAVPHDRLRQYVPQYSMNETTRWAHLPLDRARVATQETRTP